MKQVKLTANQQTVVNLMGQGWRLSWHMGTRGYECWASLRSADNRDSHKVASNVPGILEDKGVARKFKSDWNSREYELTDLGKSLVKESEKKATETWWKVIRYYDKPEPVEFAGSTDSMLIETNGRKTAKHSDYCSYYDSKESALGAIRYRLESAVESAKSTLRSAEKALADFEKKNGRTK